MSFVPWEFQDGEQLDPSKLLDNCRALDKEVRDLIEARYFRFPVLVQFYSEQIGTFSFDRRAYVRAPFRYQIDQMELTLVAGGATSDITVTWRDSSGNALGTAVTLTASSAGASHSGLFNQSIFVDENTEIYLEISTSSNWTNFEDAYVTVHCRHNSFADGVSELPDLPVISAGDTSASVASELNTWFSAMETLLDGYEPPKWFEIVNSPATIVGATDNVAAFPATFFRTSKLSAADLWYYQPASQSGGLFVDFEVEDVGGAGADELVDQNVVTPTADAITRLALTVLDPYGDGAGVSGIDTYDETSSDLDNNYLEFGTLSGNANFRKGQFALYWEGNR